MQPKNIADMEWKKIEKIASIPVLNIFFLPVYAVYKLIITVKGRVETAIDKERPNKFD